MAVVKSRRSPPSSRGLGRSPFKAKTGVRISLGAHKIAVKAVFFKTGVPARGMVFESPWGREEGVFFRLVFHYFLEVRVDVR